MPTSIRTLNCKITTKLLCQPTAYVDIYVHMHCIYSVLTYLPFHLALHKSAVDFKVTLASLILPKKKKKNKLFWIVACAIRLDYKTLLSSLSVFMLYVNVFFLHITFIGQNQVIRNHLFSCLCNSFSLCTATETYCHEFSPHKNLNKPKKPQCALSLIHI